MKLSFFFLLCFFPFTSCHRGCYIDVPLSERPSVVKTLQQVFSQNELPENFDWRNRNGVMYVSPPTNQFVPSPCGSCWAHATVGALTDRFIIATKALKSVPRLSSQVLLNIGPLMKFGSCRGGSDVLAYQFIHQYGITDETCMPYQGVDNSKWGEVPVEDQLCWQCDQDGSCGFVNGTVYHISQYGSLVGVEQMMSEIYNRGPIACSVYAHTSTFSDYKSGIIMDKTVYNSTTHVVVITGWGVDQDSGVKYWVGRNSFGTAWGEDGWFKLQRGANCLDMEEHPCAWAVPEL